MAIDELTDDMLVKAAREALTRPSDFGYFGDLPLFESWGMTFAQHRDSDALERSNYRVALADLEETQPPDMETVDTIGCRHWAVGWMDHIVVRVLRDPADEITPDNITGTFARAARLAVYVRDEYPVLDDSDYSELESEEWWELWQNVSWPDYQCGQDDETLAELDSSDVYREAQEHASEYDPAAWSDEDIAEAVERVRNRPDPDQGQIF